VSTREELLAESGQVMRDFMACAVFFQDAVAREVGLNGTDLQALGVLVSDGPASPGRLAQRTGISAGGAITQLVDRLERAGYARRERDTTDRRRVLVIADTERVGAAVGPLYAPVAREWNDYLGGLTTDELRIGVELLRKAVSINQKEIDRLASGGRATDRS
jgi:DNA-binding MarR family transcriptional regulator